MSPTEHKSEIGRYAAIAAVAVFVILLGHYAGRAMHRSIARAPHAAGRTAPPMRMYVGGTGKDAPDIPAPPASERLFTLAPPSRSGSIMIRYRSTATTGDIARFYGERMRLAGWTRRKKLDSAPDYPGILLSYSKSKGDSCIISISEDDGASSVSVLRMSRRGRP